MIGYIESMKIAGHECGIEVITRGPLVNQYRVWLDGMVVDHGAATLIAARHALYAYMEARLTREVREMKRALKTSQRSLHKVEKASPMHKLKGKW